MHEDSPEDVVHDLFTEALWPEHPLGRPILGTVETIRGGDAGHRSAASTAGTTCRATSWSRRPATCGTTTLVRLLRDRMETGRRARRAAALGVEPARAPGRRAEAVGRAPR